jgi:hypothetical protein
MEVREVPHELHEQLDVHIIIQKVRIHKLFGSDITSSLQVLSSALANSSDHSIFDHLAVFAFQIL